ncbi:hypothetical protein TRFO_26941 [Tritrichomonas foetus]|uniref:Uncharacterized protein n=1 Tax=Tritrichomonas foetus TaxID=1144522 RepID=A0A1J4K3B3_9EUKA|nr:hypothetical protein TRFO_26941 [Tritrichomonas foetus]|eukprot:OHT05320.1 hypothetical protein TRFO_26941 [Tritrichomonas foetus]
MDHSGSNFIYDEDFLCLSDEFDSEEHYTHGFMAGYRFTGFGSMDPIICPSEKVVIIQRSFSMPKFTRNIQFKDNPAPIANLPKTTSSMGVNRSDSNSNAIKIDLDKINDKVLNSITDVSNLTKYYKICSNLTFNPRKIGFAPEGKWKDEEVNFLDVIKTFFQVSTPSIKFSYKLYNALRLSEYSAEYIPLVGAAYISDVVLKINYLRFDRLLGVKDGESFLFGPQGLLPHLGFKEIQPNNLYEFGSNIDLTNIDLNHTKFFYHTSHYLSKRITPADLENLHIETF